MKDEEAGGCRRESCRVKEGPDSTGLGTALVRCDDVKGGGRDEISQVLNCEAGLYLGSYQKVLN